MPTDESGNYRPWNNLEKSLITDYVGRLARETIRGASRYTNDEIKAKVGVKFNADNRDFLTYSNLSKDALGAEFGGIQANADRQTAYDKTQLSKRYGVSGKAGDIQYELLIRVRNDRTGEISTSMMRMTRSVAASADSIQSDAMSRRAEFQHVVSPPVTGQPNRPNDTFTTSVQILSAGVLRV